DPVRREAAPGRGLLGSGEPHPGPRRRAPTLTALARLPLTDRPGGHVPNRGPHRHSADSLLYVASGGPFAPSYAATAELIAAAPEENTTCRPPERSRTSRATWSSTSTTTRPCATSTARWTAARPSPIASPTTSPAWSARGSS